MSKYYFLNLFGLRSELLELGFKEDDKRIFPMEMNYMAVDLNKKTFFAEEYAEAVIKRLDYKVIPVEYFMKKLVVFQRDKKIDNNLNDE